MLARNVIGVTGIGLLTSLVTGGLLAWILPLGYLGFAEYALTGLAQPVDLAGPPAGRPRRLDLRVLVFAVGLVAFTLRGARTRLADDG